MGGRGGLSDCCDWNLQDKMLFLKQTFNLVTANISLSIYFYQST